MIHGRQSVRGAGRPQGRPGRQEAPRSGVGGRLACVLALVVLLAAGCADGGPTQPGTLRFGQLGNIGITLEAPLRLGAGKLVQTLRWESSGAWTLQEVISYRELVGDETVTRSSGDPGLSAAAYASLITQLNEVQGLQLFVEELPDTLQPECGPTRTRVTLTILDEARRQEARWIRCGDGSLANLTPRGAGPDPAASRVMVATQFARDGTVGEAFVSAYAGSVPFGTLDRGQDTQANTREPLAIVDSTAWRSFWSDHRPANPLPPVDFGAEMVIVGILGERSEAGDSVEVRRILQVDEGTLTEVFERVPGDFCSPAARRHVPYHIVVSPRTPDPLRFSDTRRELVPCG